MNKTSGAVLAATLLLSSIAAPAAAAVVRLETLEQRALAHHVTLARSRARGTGASARAEIARAAARPSLTFRADAALAPGGTLVRINDVQGDEYWVSGSRPLGRDRAFAPEPRYGASLALQSNLYDFGRTRDRVQAAERLVEAAGADADATRAEIVRVLRAAYLAWLVAHGEAAIARANARSAAERQRDSEARVEEGARAPAELLAIRGEAARARLQLAEANGRERRARIELESASAGPIAVTDEPDPSLLELGPSSPAARSPTIRTLERRRDAALANARSHDHQLAPVIGGLAEAGVRGQSGVVLPLYRVGVELTVPIWDSGAEAAQRDLAHAEAAELAAEIDDQNQAHTSAGRIARVEFVAAQEQVLAAEELVRASEATLRAAEERQALGAGNEESTIQARAQQTTAALELLHARATRADAALRLLALAR